MSDGGVCRLAVQGAAGDIRRGKVGQRDLAAMSSVIVGGVVLGRCRRFPCPAWDVDAERTSLAGTVAESFDATAVLTHDAIDDRQAEARSFAGRSLGEKRLVEV